ncbi:MAG: acyltransferase domain-containing protein, partial [Candidatus Hydrogenedentota bacterium]
YSVIKGVGSSSDGKFKSIYAPRPQGQSKALRRAYADAGFAPSTVGLIEAHGTGTAAGDAAEFEGLREVFADRNDCTQHIALGSVKSQIGHLKAAAGAAGIIKCALALHHKVLPATLSVSKPNPKLDVENSPFYINTEVRPWVAPADGSPRRTGTSSFGFGGTNFHVVMEEYSPRQTGAYRLNPVAQPSLVSAPNLTQLRSALDEALDGLRDEKDLERYKSFLKESELREIPANHPRIGFVSLNIEEGIEQIERSIEGLENDSGKGFWELPQGICFRSTALECEGGIVALFSGQGSQYVGMGNELANNFPTYLESVESMDRHYVDDDLPRLSETVFPIPVFDEEAKSANDKTLQQTPFAQPGIGTFSAGTYKIFTEAGFKADFVAGHSFGELTALWAAGVYDEDDFYALAKARGQAMSAPDDKDFDAGTMAAVIGDVANLSEDLGDFPEVVIANYNSKSQIVIAGPKVAIEKASVYLKEKGYKAIALPVSGAFHTTLVRHAQAPFAEA